MLQSDSAAPIPPPQSQQSVFVVDQGPRVHPLGAKIFNARTGEICFEPKILFERNEKQELAFRVLMCGAVNELLYGGGMGGGKTALMIACALYSAYRYPGSTIVVMRAELQPLRELFEEFRKVIPRELLKKQPTFLPHPKIEFKNGSRIIGLGGHDYEAIRGLNDVSFVGTDEAHQFRKGICPEIAGRKRSTLDFQINMKWLACSNPEYGDIRDLFYADDPKRPPTRRFIQALVWDNGYLANIEETVAEWRQRFSAHDFEKLVLGNWDFPGGSKFKAFSRDIHARKFDLPQPLTWMTAVGFDHGWNHPTYLCYGGMDERSVGWIFDELYLIGATPLEIARLHREKCLRWGLLAGQALVVADCSIATIQATSGVNMHHALTFQASQILGPEYAMNIVMADKSRQGLESIEVALEARKLFIHEERCPWLIKALAEARAAKPTPREAAAGLLSERLDEHMKDPVDGLKYWMNWAVKSKGSPNLQWEPRKAWEPQLARLEKELKAHGRGLSGPAGGDRGGNRGEFRRREFRGWRGMRPQW